MKCCGHSRKEREIYMSVCRLFRRGTWARAGFAAAAALLALAGMSSVAFGARAQSSPRLASPANSPAPPPSPWPGGVWQPEPALYGQAAETNVPFTMPDGTTLVGDIVYPTDPATGQQAPGRFPVIVTMTPYHVIAGTNPDAPDYMVQRGYIHVTFDVRGTGRSGGTYTLLSPQQLRDFVDLADYCARNLPGADGKAALAGQSYLGDDALAAGRYIQPGSAIKAIFAAAAGDDVFREPFDGGGIPTTFSYAYNALGEDDDGGIAPGYTADAQSGGPLAYEGQFWQERRPINAVPELVRAQIPVLMVSGAADYPAMGSLEEYTALQNAAHGRSIWAPMDPRLPASGRYQLIWGTLADSSTVYTYDYDPYELEWFDTFIKGEQTRVADTTQPLHLYEWQAKEWTDAASYPLTTRATRLYLTGSTTAPQPYAMNNGGLSPRPSAATGAADEIQWAPPATPPTPNAASNILDYTSEPFANGALVAGPITAQFDATTDASNIELVATLLDVAPDGTTTTVFNQWNADGALLASDRAVDPTRSWYDNDGGLLFAYHPLTQAAQEPVTAGHPVTMDITLSPRMWALLPGHRLRLQVTTQALTPPAQLGAPFASPTLLTPTTPQVSQLTGATFSIGRSGQEQSYIDLPLLPLNAFPPDSAWAQTSYTDGSSPASSGS
jgi:uncharacterized protein